MRLLAAALTGLIGPGSAALADTAPQLEFRTPSAAFVIGFRDLVGVLPEPEGYLTYRMDPAAQAVFAAFTARNLGARMHVLVCGEKVLEAVLQAQIDSGVLVHAVEDPAQAKTILDRVAGASDCPAAAR